LESAGVAVSMDGRGRALDNVFVERLWRSLKYEEVYLKDYRSVAELESGLTSWFRFDNHERPHQSLKYRTPAEVYQKAGRSSG
jgi:putative transposase